MLNFFCIRPMFNMFKQAGGSLSRWLAPTFLSAATAEHPNFKDVLSSDRERCCLHCFNVIRYVLYALLIVSRFCEKKLLEFSPSTF